MLAFADRIAHDESELLLFAGRIKDAAMRCPYNWPAWRAYTDSLKSKNASIDEWRTYIGDLIKFMPDGRLSTWDFADEALGELAKKGMKKTPLANEAVRLFKGLPQPKSKIAEEMDFAKDALGRILKRFKGYSKCEDRILAAAVAANADTKDYLPQIFGYAIGRFEKNKKRLGEFFKLAARELAPNAGTLQNDGKDDGSINWRLLSSIRSCQENREAFRMMADFRNLEEPPTGDGVVAQEDYGSPLVSSDALVVISKSSKYDTPEDHARVSDATPYDIKRKFLLKTSIQSEPWAIVELAGDVVVKGITLVGGTADVDVSVAGEDGVWKVLNGKEFKDGVMRIALPDNTTPMRSVKVSYPLEKGKKSLSLKKILVYGQKLY